MLKLIVSHHSRVIFSSGRYEIVELFPQCVQAVKLVKHSNVIHALPFDLDGTRQSGSLFTPVGSLDKSAAAFYSTKSATFIYRDVWEDTYEA